MLNILGGLDAAHFGEQMDNPPAHKHCHGWSSPSKCRFANQKYQASRTLTLLNSESSNIIPQDHSSSEWETFCEISILQGQVWN